MRVFGAALADASGPGLLIRHVSSIWYSVSSHRPPDPSRAGRCELDMEQHCKWIVYGTDGLGSRAQASHLKLRGCTRMRPKLHLAVLGRAFRVRVTGVMAYRDVVRVVRYKSFVPPYGPLAL